MKIHVVILGAIVMIASCNSKPQPGAEGTADSLRMAADTTWPGRVPGNES
jgi:hypothetical protein